jgi:hypothetical protein
MARDLKKNPALTGTGLWIFSLKCGQNPPLRTVQTVTDRGYISDRCLWHDILTNRVKENPEQFKNQV